MYPLAEQNEALVAQADQGGVAADEAPVDEAPGGGFPFDEVAANGLPKEFKAAEVADTCQANLLMPELE